MGKGGRRPHPDILTPREWEVLGLLRDRLTNEQIAQRLGITLDGAKYHVSEILSKLGVGTREEAAAWRAAHLGPWWTRLIALPTAAKIAGGLTLVAAAAGLAVLAWGVVETGGPSEPGISEPAQAGSSAPVQAAPNSSSAGCKNSVAVILDVQPACAFTFEAKDVPARLQAYPLQVRPERIQTFGDIVLHATCAPEGSCSSFVTGDPVIEETTIQLDWIIDQPATIVVSAHELVRADSIPVREYRLVDFAYDHPADRICTADRLYCYVFTANYERSN
jgi:DNA-binding CsgD family transcriptional regulator